jgi:leader peptidase (prepilin peptidase)/N-methyltransferase
MGSFLNVVVYRLPEGLSIISPGSHCTTCKHRIPWYDNIPVFSWFILRGRCRHCGAAFSVRYAVVEFITGFLFAGLYWCYFVAGFRGDMPAFEQGGWVLYLGHVFLVWMLLAASLIDAKHWIIPLGLTYTAVVVAFLLSIAWPYQLDSVSMLNYWRVIPFASPITAALAIGAALGLLISFILTRTGVLTRSYAEWEAAVVQAEADGIELDPEEMDINVRLEMWREILFLLPIGLFALIAGYLVRAGGPCEESWQQVLSEHKWLTGLLGSVYGFMIGGAVVWITRILGSLVFGREAMGLGDVHLMAAVGAMLGWQSPTIAFFVAPFFGLGWAIARLVLHRTREIPYGPFLSLGTVVVMLMQDPIVEYFQQAFQAAGSVP